MIITNNHGCIEPYVNSILNDPYKHDGDISATSLIKSPRMVLLVNRHWDEIVKDVVEFWKLQLGKAFHLLMERESFLDGFQEERINVNINGWVVSGQIDLYNYYEATVDDYKTTSLWSIIFGGKTEWEQQLNIYAYLLYSAGFPVEHLRVFYGLTDWSKTNCKRISGCPKVPVGTLNIPLWTTSQQYEYIEERVKLHQHCRDIPDNDLPFCTPEERWQRPTKWAVVKGENKKASRVLDTEELAKDWIKNYKGKGGDKMKIIKRPGVNKRCDDYCDAKFFCSQYQESAFNFGEEEE